jgi:hypothetical protein
MSAETKRMNVFGRYPSLWVERVIRCVEEWKPLGPVTPPS